MVQRIIIEAVILGFLTVFAAYVKCALMNGDVANIYDSEYKEFFITFFIIGVILHLFYEYTGLNARWCKRRL